MINQDKNQPVSLEEQIIYLYALNKGILDNLSMTQIKQFRKDILKFVNQHYPQFCSKIRETRELSEELTQDLEDALKIYFTETFK